MPPGAGMQGGQRPPRERDGETRFDVRNLGRIRVYSHAQRGCAVSPWVRIKMLTRQRAECPPETTKVRIFDNRL